MCYHSVLCFLYSPLLSEALNIIKGDFLTVVSGCGLSTYMITSLVATFFTQLWESANSSINKSRCEYSPVTCYPDSLRVGCGKGHIKILSSFYESYMNRKSQRRFRMKLPGVWFPYGNSVQNLVYKVSVVLISRKPKFQHQVLTEQKLESIRAKIE